MSDFIFEWSPAEWKEFVAASRKKANRILTDEKLFKKFDEIVQEQIAVVEENGGTEADVKKPENILDIIWRNNFE
jgi:hypothetical protein